MDTQVWYLKQELRTQWRIQRGVRGGGGAEPPPYLNKIYQNCQNIGIWSTKFTVTLIASFLFNNVF